MNSQQQTNKITKQGSPPVRIFENPADDTTFYSEHF